MAAPSTSQAAAGGGGGGGSVKLYGQCGAGKGDWTGPTMCAEGTCQAIQEYYSYVEALKDWMKKC